MRIFGAILTVIVFGIFGFVATIIASLTRNAEFYVPFSITVTVALIVIIHLAIYGQLKKKVTKISVLTFVCLLVVSLASYEGYQAYIRSLEIMSTQDVDLSEYRPFAEDTKAVSLEEESTFKIETNIPTLDGATALYPVYAAFAQAVYPEKMYPLEESEIVSSQTSDAFYRLIKKDVDMIFMAHPSEEQMQLAARQGIELSLTPIGREAFVFFVNKNNPVKELTIKQIQGIYAGNIINWDELGGNNEEIRAFQRPDGSGSQSALISVMDGIPLMDPPSEDIVSGMGGVIIETSSFQNRSNAIGYSFRHFSEEMVENGEIRHIAIEGILPTVENIQNEAYPIVDQFYAITADSDNPHINQFIEWIKSDQGQEIIDRTGYVPLK
ncbi:hypothetical protein GH741_20500 [Aquibacillus halophilus]|uniref:PBP domain-containing protein n=1 Tax=Aquibacillus halophilus TaxID=930132 RepID=A0A6A8DPN9_9BACI|nr:substrate-binding domain-containing protein [Aquibacillus halophilus]MRH45027.1 hypothetical protein [Aquibacillus halophilus]